MKKIWGSYQGYTEMAKSTGMEAWHAMGWWDRKLTLIEHLLWAGYFLHIIIIKTLTANFEAGTIIPIFQDIDAQWGEVTQPSFPLPVNRQQGCPPRFVFVLFFFCLMVLLNKPLSVFWAPQSSSVPVPRWGRGFWGPSTQSWPQGKQGYRPGEERVMSSGWTREGRE